MPASLSDVALNSRQLVLGRVAGGTGRAALAATVDATTRELFYYETARVEVVRTLGSDGKPLVDEGSTALLAVERPDPTTAAKYQTGDLEAYPEGPIYPGDGELGLFFLISDITLGGGGPEEAIYLGGVLTGPSLSSFTGESLTALDSSVQARGLDPDLRLSGVLGTLSGTQTTVSEAADVAVEEFDVLPQDEPPPDATVESGSPQPEGRGAPAETGAVVTPAP